MIRERISQLRDHIAQICQKCGRDPQEITLIGVTKFAETSHIKEAIEAGLTDIGENKVQQAQAKFPELDQAGIKVNKHMIGHLQTNKVRAAVELFDMIQSVDSLKVASAINEQAGKVSKKMQVLIEINASHEEQKYGFKPDEALEAAGQIAELKNVEVLGIMGMAEQTEDKDVIRGSFIALRELKEKIFEQLAGKVDMKYLSMGMTNDYDIAIEEGSNMVRIGRAIFIDE